MRLLSLRPDDSRTTPRVALSIGFKNSVSFLLAIQATRLLTLTSVGLNCPPTEHASLRWTHITARYFSSCPSDSTSRWTPCPPKYSKRWLQVSLGCIRLSPSCRRDRTRTRRL